jgi:hypothetical protein
MEQRKQLARAMATKKKLRPIKSKYEDSLGPQRTAQLVNRGYTYSNGYWRQTKPPYRRPAPFTPSQLLA